VVEVQAEPKRYLLAGACSHIVDTACHNSREHPANVDSRHWFLEALLRHQCADGLDRCRESWWIFLRSVANSTTHPSSMLCSWRKRVLGCQLLWWPEAVNLPNKGHRLGYSDRLHLGRICVHVHWRLDGYPAPRQAQEAVASRPSRPISPWREAISFQWATCPSRPRSPFVWERSDFTFRNH